MDFPKQINKTLETQEQEHPRIIGQLQKMEHMHDGIPGRRRGKGAEEIRLSISPQINASHQTTGLGTSENVKQDKYKTIMATTTTTTTTTQGNYF